MLLLHVKLAPELAYGHLDPGYVKNHIKEHEFWTSGESCIHIQIKIGTSKDKLRILIKILVWEIKLGDKIDIPDRQTSPIFYEE